MRIQVKIRIGEEDTIPYMYFNSAELPPLSNVSKVDEAIGGTSIGYNGFQLSSSENKTTRLRGVAKLFSSAGYSGILTSETSDATGDCDILIPFYIRGDTPKNLYIGFDSIVNEYAVNFIVSTEASEASVVVTENNSCVTVIDMSQLQLPDTLNNTKFYLRITKWSKANTSIKISRLSTFYLLVYSGSDLKSVINSENLLDAQMQIVPGICEQYANISLYDRYNILKQFALLNKLTSDYVVTIDAIDDTSGTTYETGNYIVSDWDFQGISSSIGISCRDKSYLFEKINITRTSIMDRSLDVLLGELFSQAKGVSWRYLDDETRERCTQIIVPDSWYLASDLYTMLNKLCTLGMLRIYWYIDTFVVGRCC